MDRTQYLIDIIDIACLD